MRELTLTLYYSLDDKIFTKNTPDDTFLMVCVELEVSIPPVEMEEGHGFHDISSMETNILSIYRLDTIGGIMSPDDIKETILNLGEINPNDYL